MKKRILSLLLAAVMLATLSVLTVSAEDAVSQVSIKPTTLPQYYVTEKSANCFPETAGTYLGSADAPSAADPGADTNPGEYALASGDFSVEVADNKATLTLGENTTNYDLLRILFKSRGLEGTNYLTLHVDATNLTADEGFNFHVNNIWTACDLAQGSTYYFLPDATEENPNPKREKRVVGDTTFEGLVIKAGDKGTLYLPASSFGVNFYSYLEWSITHGTRENAALYIENKNEYTGAAAGDTIVFSDMRWVKEDAVSAKVTYNAEYVANDFDSTEIGNHQFTAAPGRWDNWTSVSIGKAFDSSFKAVKFDLDYSQFLGNECYMNLRYSFKRMVEEVETAYSCHVVGTVYLVSENGYVYTQTPNTGWNNNIVLPSGFKGSVVVPFTSFNNAEALYSQDAYNCNITIQAYGTSAESTITATIDNIGFMTEFVADDLVAMRKSLLGDEAVSVVDLNGDGKVDIFDLIRIKKILTNGF